MTAPGAKRGITLIARAIRNKRHKPVRVVTTALVAVILASLLFVISAYAWGKGENIYVIFLNGYRFLFGFGI